MTIDITTKALVAVLALCITFCWVSASGRKHRRDQDRKDAANHPSRWG